MTTYQWIQLAIAILMFAIMMLLGGGSKNQLSTGKTVGMAEKLNATRVAMKQIRERKPNKPCLWMGAPTGIPNFWFKREPWRSLGAQVQVLLGQPPAIFVPFAAQSILALGTPGSGKTESALKGLFESALRQGFPMILYDKKGDLMEELAPLAKRLGYEVYVLAPGEPYSQVFNPLDYIRDHHDSAMAMSLAKTINRNSNDGGGGRTDPFFENAGDLLSRALLQLTCKPEFREAGLSDMATLYAVLSLPNLVERIEYAVGTGTIDPFLRASFTQFLSVKEADKTISSILGMAAGTFAGFIQPDLLRVFMGESTIPRKLKAKQLVICKLEDERRAVVGPLLAAAIQLMVVSNLSAERDTPLIVGLDEAPSLKFELLPQWINEYRSRGGCFLLGIQTLDQLFEAYGERMGWAVQQGCGTDILFRVTSTKTAEDYSKSYGKRDVKIRSKSTGSHPGQMGSSVTWNESIHQVEILSSDEIQRMLPGFCGMRNQAYAGRINKPGGGDRKEGYFPYLLQVPYNENIARSRSDQYKKLWREQMRPELEKKVTLPTADALQTALEHRIQKAEELLPLPDKKGKGKQVAAGKDKSNPPPRQYQMPNP